MCLDQRRLDRQTRSVCLLVSREQFHLSGIPPQLAGDRQDALQIHASGRNTEVRSGLFQQTGYAFGAEHIRTSFSKTSTRWMSAWMSL